MLLHLTAFDTTTLVLPMAGGVGMADCGSVLSQIDILDWSFSGCFIVPSKALPSSSTVAASSEN